MYLADYQGVRETAKRSLRSEISSQITELHGESGTFVARGARLKGAIPYPPLATSDPNQAAGCA